MGCDEEGEGSTAVPDSKVVESLRDLVRKPMKAIAPRYPVPTVGEQGTAEGKAVRDDG
ncbi:hypothetical protein GLOTRDRAFT_111443 [Gloeophyllum trabeum ATCC 11539]|uniref:Uncharacterized protein n=1 Tax=Gloeophyllum trabeum (strain ATCC 11539 / FP-39264 / Madison 617) TaxID=670483 RepID=S7RKF3_GLOTA|nr:uncharacterized protein GLOTRDRAFT_111443 [Gloeophyllum trabeum ATCC 11539]EPQ54870.1 hypothetical protein GLOTRDRAFT_111443 [Gloeophyllum trabeum ATCC 11539]